MAGNFSRYPHTKVADLKMKEKNKVLDTNNTFYKFLKSLSETKTKGYEICNVVDDDGDSIYAADIEDLTKDEGQVFISTDAVESFSV